MWLQIELRQTLGRCLVHPQPMLQVPLHTTMVVIHSLQRGLQKTRSRAKSRSTPPQALN